MKLFNLHVPPAALALVLVDAIILHVSISIGLHWSYATFWQVYSAAAGEFWDAMLFTLVVIVCAFTMGLYHRQHMGDIKVVILRLLVAFGLALFAMSVIFYLFPVARIWLSALGPGLMIGFVGLVLSRAAFLRLSNAATFKKRVMVLGAGSNAKRIQGLAEDANARFLCLGFVPMGPGGILVDEDRLVRANEPLPALCGTLGVDEIVTALEDRRLVLPVDELLDCRLHGVSVTNFSTFIEQQTGQVELQSLYPSWLVFNEGFAGGSIVQRRIKRGIDVLVSTVFLTATCPLMAVTALAIYLEDRGPVFYRQERVGLQGRVFRVMKFRSMRVDAERDGIARWAQVRDPRITRVGNFIRGSRIDEIPQIINVLRGEMSFVGPRPERPSIVAELEEHIPYYSYRHMVKPGITGWAQINYPYGASLHDAREKLKYDVYYIKNYSVLLDFVTILQTVRVVLWPQGVR
jgi:sugar transferase (PEP-CTERM system associated)